MKRWLALLILLTPCSGCMLFDDMIDDGPPYARVSVPPNQCGIVQVNAVQTAEPELRR